MELNVVDRSKEDNLKILRHMGKIPAVLYSKKENLFLCLDAREFEKKNSCIEK